MTLEGSTPSPFLTVTQFHTCMIFLSLSGKTVFSKIDLKRAYYQIPVEPSDPVYVSIVIVTSPFLD